MKNYRIEKVGNEYFLRNSEGTYNEKCSIWFEKKTNSNHVKLPKENPSGRTYVRQIIVDKFGCYEFEEKTEHRTLEGGGWRNKLTDEEKVEIENLEKRIDEIKAIAMARPTEKLDKNSVEYIEREIAKLLKKKELMSK